MIHIPPQTLLDAATSVLFAAEPGVKTAAAETADRLRVAGAPLGHEPSLLNRPSRPQRPALVAPGAAPKRRLGSAEGRAVFLHAIAHIEFNAIDLAFDMAARFTGAVAAAGLDAASFAADWVQIGCEEARHFRLLEDRLAELGVAYGDFPAHDGLWQAADDTKYDPLARLVIAPLILEARGLDVTPDMAERLRAAGDDRSAAALETIYGEEIGHVACGKHWFDKLCAARNLLPDEEFHRLRKLHFSGILKPPFNHDARAQAGLSRTFYEPGGL